MFGSEKFFSMILSTWWDGPKGKGKRGSGMGQRGKWDRKGEVGWAKGGSGKGKGQWEGKGEVGWAKGKWDVGEVGWVKGKWYGPKESGM